MAEAAHRPAGEPLSQGWSPVWGLWAPGPRLPSLPITPGMMRQEKPSAGPLGLWKMVLRPEGAEELSHLTALFFAWGHLCPSFSPSSHCTPPSPGWQDSWGPLWPGGHILGPRGERTPHCREWPPLPAGK